MSTARCPCPVPSLLLAFPAPSPSLLTPYPSPLTPHPSFVLLPCPDTRNWAREEAAQGQPPSARDRHVAVVHGKYFYVFGGYDGATRVNDFYCYDIEEKSWAEAEVSQGIYPTPRHSHAAVVHQDSMYVFGGYDGSYRNDFHEFNFVSKSWSAVRAVGRVPRARYRTVCVVHRNHMVLFGGHDGARHLNDVHLFDFTRRIWSPLETKGPPPIPRDSHVAVANGSAIYIYGGSTGSAMNDFYELRLDTETWSTVSMIGPPPCPRFCHAAVQIGDSMLIFGGYDGSERLNDFQQFVFGPDVTATCHIPPGNLVADLRGFIDDQDTSDVTFIVEGKPVYAHKLLCTRCEYFKAMLSGEMMESRAREIVMPDVRHAIFLAVLEYLYTDEVEVPLDTTMELFQAADKFGIARLKLICECRYVGEEGVCGVVVVGVVVGMCLCEEREREKCVVLCK